MSIRKRNVTCSMKKVKYLTLLFNVLILFNFESSAFAVVTDRDIEALRAEIVQLDRKIKNIIPIGTILLHVSHTTIPEGYMICDGREVSRVDYEDLFSKIGLKFTPDVTLVAPRFRIPDLRERTGLRNTQRNQQRNVNAGEFFEEAPFIIRVK